MQTAEKVKQIIAQEMGLKPEDIVDQAKLTEDLNMESFDRVELVMALEEGFNIEIPDEDAQKLTTVKEVIDYVESKVNKN